MVNKAFNEFCRAISLRPQVRVVARRFSVKAGRQRALFEPQPMYDNPLEKL